MTKFEEELKKSFRGFITIELMKKLVEEFGNWHSDEEFKIEEDAVKIIIAENKGLKEQLQEKATKLTFAEEEIHELGDKIGQLEYQLQQQALPVVKDFVAEWYQEQKDRLELAVYDINTSIHRKSWHDRTVIEEWFAKVSNKPIETIFKMKDGYTVEKPQLFYLKHIDMSKSDAHLNWYLAKGTDNVLIHQGIKKGKLPKLKCILKLTQQEIDSMNTGSYEQIEVAE